uniref:Uncharacterized protein n=1 Tax=Podarcis muralis TaxID=64176 RepID=A0A670J4C1_PODMU
VEGRVGRLVEQKSHGVGLLSLGEQDSVAPQDHCFVLDLVPVDPGEDLGVPPIGHAVGDAVQQVGMARPPEPFLAGAHADAMGAEGQLHLGAADSPTGRRTGVPPPREGSPGPNSPSPSCLGDSSRFGSAFLPARSRDRRRGSRGGGGVPARCSASLSGRAQSAARAIRALSRAARLPVSLHV